jgi:GNAT superfamily N-acetyltransferase
MTIAAIDPIRIEEAGLNALQTRRQLFFDGWLLRLSPGKAKRARSVNPHFGSSLPVDEKIDRCERIYAARELPALFRMTPFVKPVDLGPALERRGYVVFDSTLVQGVSLARLPDVALPAHVELVTPSLAEFVDAIGDMRRSSPVQRAAHLERLACTPLAMHAVVARVDDRAVGCGQVALDDRLAGVYDMMTVADMRGRGVAKVIVRALLTWASQHGATHGFLQVNDDNLPARAVYRRFGFETTYAYHYRARPDECR